MLPWAAVLHVPPQGRGSWQPGWVSCKQGSRVWAHRLLAAVTSALLVSGAQVPCVQCSVQSCQGSEDGFANCRGRWRCLIHVNCA